MWGEHLRENSAQYALFYWIIFASIISLISFIFWVLQVIRLLKRKDKTAGVCILVIGIIICLIGILNWIVPLLWIPTVVAAFLGRSPEQEQTTKEQDFYCASCHIKYKEEFLEEKIPWKGKVCRHCLSKEKETKN